MNERRHLWIVTGLVGLAFALRVVGLDAQGLWRDEVDAIRFASRSLGELAGLFATPGQNGPLFYLLLRPWLDLAGRSEFALRFFSLVFGTLAVPLVYRLGRRLFSSLPFLAFLAALLAAVSPYLVWYGQEGKMYALVVFLVLLSMDRYLAALEEGGVHRWLGYILATSAAFYVHLLAALMVPVQVLVFFLVAGRIRRRRWKPWLASMAALTVPYLPLLIWQLPLLLKAADTGYRFVPLQEMILSLVEGYSLGVVQAATVWTVALFVGMVLVAGLLWQGRPSHRVSLGILVCWLVIPVLGIFLITLLRPMYAARYLIFVLPAYLLLLSAGVVAISRQSRLVGGLVLVGVLAASGWGVWLQTRTPLKADFRAATGYVAGRHRPGDLILFQIPYGRHSFDYYYIQPKPALQPDGGELRAFMPLVVRSGGVGAYRWAEGLYTNGGMMPEEAARRMAEITAESRVVWLVATEVPLWDERGLVLGWLEEHATSSDAAQFTRVAVYRFELP